MIDHDKRLRSFGESLDFVLNRNEDLQRTIDSQGNDVARLRKHFWKIVKAFHGWEDGENHVYSEADQAELIADWIRNAKRALK